MQQENEVPSQHKTSWKCYCVVWACKIECTYFENILITEKVELIKKATGKTSAVILRRRDDNCLDAAKLYSRTIKPSTKTCVF